MCFKCQSKKSSNSKTETDKRIIDIKELGQQDRDMGQQVNDVGLHGKEVDHQDKEMMSMSGQLKAGVYSSPTNVQLINIKEYQTNLDDIELLAVSLNGSKWIGNGMYKEGLNPLTTQTALQHVRIDEGKLNIKSSFNMLVWDIAVTPDNDILLATGKPRLMKIRPRSNRLADSNFCAGTALMSVHVTKANRVIAGGRKFVAVMDTDGNLLKRYENDMNRKPYFDGNILSITSTINGHIFVIQRTNNPKVFVLGKDDIINDYKGHPLVNSHNKFHPMSVVVTPVDNVIVADDINHTLHILDNNGHLLTTYNTKNIGLKYPRCLASTREVLYIGCLGGGKLYQMNIKGC